MYAFSPAAWKSIAYNCMVWAIPGALFLAFYLLLIAISIDGGDGSLLGIEWKLPKGLLSFMGVGLLVFAVLAMVCFFTLDIRDFDSFLFLSFFSLITAVAGTVFLRRELKRLSV